MADLENDHSVAEATAVEPALESVPEVSAEGNPAEPAMDYKALYEEANDKYLRMLAETENYKKRVQRERSEERQYAAQETLSVFLPVADNLDRALQASLKQGEAGNLTKGVEMTLRQFEDVLRRMGVEAIETEIGKPFDPHLHQALFKEDHAEFDDGSILEVLQRGYRLGERVIRPAMVKVSHKP